MILSIFLLCFIIRPDTSSIFSRKPNARVVRASSNRVMWDVYCCIASPNKRGSWGCSCIQTVMSNPIMFSDSTAQQWCCEQISCLCHGSVFQVSFTSFLVFPFLHWSQWNYLISFNGLTLLIVIYGELCLIFYLIANNLNIPQRGFVFTIVNLIYGWGD